MTCCLSICLPHASLSAADTRVAIEHDGQRTLHDGPLPLSVTVSSIGRTLIYPYRYRKIRKIGNGWAVCAGEFSSATAVLDALKARSAEFFTQARAALLSDGTLFDRISRETGIVERQLRDTILIGAPLGTSTQVWTLGLRTNDPRTNRAVGNFGINWPNEVPLARRSTAEDQLSLDIRSATVSTSPLQYAKAMASLVAVAAEHGDSVSRHVQVGITVRNPDGNYHSVYFEGLGSDLMRMGDEEFSRRSEVAA